MAPLTFVYEVDPVFPANSPLNSPFFAVPSLTTPWSIFVIYQAVCFENALWLSGTAFAITFPSWSFISWIKYGWMFSPFSANARYAPANWSGVIPSFNPPRAIASPLSSKGIPSFVRYCLLVSTPSWFNVQTAAAFLESFRASYIVTFSAYWPSTFLGVYPP